ncbi:MAG: MFS transporter [Chloroflexota bacterium]
MKTYTIIWFGQLASSLGTAMTRFALLIWAYQQTGEAMTLALLGFFNWLPFIILLPFAGVWVDKLNRRWVLILADVGAGLVTLLLLGLFWADSLAIWHLYLLETLLSVFDAFQNPAYTASITSLIKKSDYSRASGMRSLSQNASLVFAPLTAGLLLTLVGLGGVLIIDIITFLIAMGTLFVVRIPQPKPMKQDEAESFWRRITFGFRFIYARKGLFGLMLIFVGVHFFAALTYFSILPAMILARSGNNEIALATTQAALGIAGIAGGIVVSIWGGPKRLIHGALAATAISFLFGDFLYAIGQNVLMWVIAASVAAFFIPFITAANRAIWQAKVPPAIQGRVHSVRITSENFTRPIGYVFGGYLADNIFEPAMMEGGSWAPTFGWLIGTGPGAGMGLMFLCTAVGGCLVSLSGYLSPAIRNVETMLPDHDEVEIYATS